MCSAPTQPVRWPARILGAVALACLATLSLIDRGTSLMYAWPGEWVYWTGILATGLMLVWRTTDRARPLRLPAAPWLWLTTGAWVTLFASALLSPYRAVCLPWIGLPLAGLAVFILLHDWLQAATENSIRLQKYQVAAAALLMLASLGYWLVDVRGLTAADFFSSTLFEMRNPHPLGHSNYTAGLALLCLPVLAQHAVGSLGKARGLAGISAGLAFLVLFTSGSRGGLLGIVAWGAAAVLLSSLPRRRIGMLLGGVLLLAGIMAVANPRIRALLAPADAATEPNISSVQRHAMITAGLHMGADRPLLGWGLHTTPWVYPRYRAMLDGGAENVLQLHSTPIELWAGLGAAGLLLLGGLIVLVIRNRARAPVAAATLTGYAVFALTDYQLDVPVFVVGLAVLVTQLAAPSPQPGSARFRHGLLAALLGTALIVVIVGQRDPTPALNTTALMVARDPANAPAAIARLKESLVLNPNQEIAHFNLGWLLVVSAPAEAETHFLAAARLVPDKGGVYFGLGLAQLNQGRSTAAARSLALECLNDPRFLASPWWREPALAALRETAAGTFTHFCATISADEHLAHWRHHYANQLATLAPRLGQPSPGPERTYHRERTGYPILMRDLNLPPPTDLYDVLEDPRFPASVPFTLPAKGWLPAPLLLKLLDANLASAHQ